MSTAVTASAVWDEGKLRVLEPQALVRKLRACKWGQGAALVVRVEPEEDAHTYGQLQHYWGHVVTPLSEWNGDFKEDWHLRLKLDFMPTDPATGKQKTSLTQLTREEMKEYVLRCEVYAHHAHPEAFALVGHGQ